MSVIGECPSVTVVGVPRELRAGRIDVGGESHRAVRDVLRVGFPDVPKGVPDFRHVIVGASLTVLAPHGRA